MEKISLQNFYPNELEVKDINQTEKLVTIKMNAHSKSCCCPKCGVASTHKHGTYKRKIRDLPILGKAAILLVNAYEYQCDNAECDVTTFAETVHGFLSYYSRMTERCAAFICTLAMETSCEGCSRICKEMNLNISGDSVIRLLTKRYKEQEKSKCGSIIGVDDFAFKKRHTYGTIIVDELTHTPVAILDGRDGKNLKEWLRKNKQVKIVTRDRASAYASAIQEVLPDAMQVADRFHLHQNLLEAVKSTVNSTIPVDVKIPQKDTEEQSVESEPENITGKKNAIYCG